MVNARKLNGRAERPDLFAATRGEQLYMWRMREGITQEEGAKRLFLGERAYLEAEHDRLDFRLPKGVRLPKRFKLPELCYLARRRHGLTLEATAKAFGVSKVTLLARERRADPELVAAWEKRGYLFRQPRYIQA